MEGRKRLLILPLRELLYSGIEGRIGLNRDKQ